MASKHTIFIGALFHVAVAVLESDSSTLRITLPESSLEPLPCTSQLPVAAARACQHLGRLSIAKIGMDVSICTLSPLPIPSLGASCCFSLALCSLLKAQMSEVAVSFPRGRAVTPAWVTALQLPGPKLSQTAQLLWPENT